MKYQIKTTFKKANEGVQMIQRSGGTYAGGRFSVKGVEGTARYDDATGMLYVNITDKPFLASWGMSESKWKEFFS